MLGVLVVVVLGVKVVEVNVLVVVVMDFAPSGGGEIVDSLY